MFPLPTTQTYEAGLPQEAGIPGIRDNAVPVIYGTGADTVYSSTPQYGSEEPILVAGCYTGAFRYTGRLERLGHGSGPRTGPTSRDIRD